MTAQDANDSTIRPEADQQRQWKAPTTAMASVLVGVAMLASGYWIVSAALRLDTDRNAAPTTAMLSHRSAARSVDRVVDARLAKDRLEALLGPGGPSAAANSSAGAKLQSVLSGQDAAIADSQFLVTSIRSRTASLARLLATQLEPCDVQRQLVAEAERIKKLPREDRREQLEAIVAAGLKKKAGLSSMVRTWTDGLKRDPVLSAVWTRLVATRKGPVSLASLPEYLELTLDVQTLPDAIARQIAADVTIEAMSATELELVGNDLARRLAWATTAVLFCGLWVALMAIGFWQTSTLLSGPRTAIVVAAILAAGGGVAYLCWEADAGRLEVLGPVLRELDAETGTGILGTSRVLNGLTGAALIAMIVTAAAITHVNDRARLESQLEGLRLTFNAAAALLVAGALEVAALYGWAAGSVQQGSEVLSKAALLSAGLVGAFFSAVLLVIYIPAASILRQRAERVSATTLLVEQGFSSSPFQLFARILQALAPLLAAVPFSALVTLLT